MRWFDAAAVVVALAVLAAVPSARADCVRCHAALGDARLRGPAEAWEGSVHSDAVGCALCHGGDADDPTVRAHALDAGFRGRPSRDEVALLCGGCHGDARFVRRFSAELPTDQLSLFQMSRHGRLAAAGDQRAPVCTSCHGSHDVASVSDPRSPVHPRNLPSLCAKCHAGPDRPRGASDPVAAYLRGAHAEAFERGDTRAPSCSGCHSGHGELTVGAGSLGGVCSGCHREELRRFRDSPHAKPFKRLGLSTCMPCHDNHDVVPTGPFLLSTSAEGNCGRCHAADEEPGKIAERLRLALTHAHDRAENARARLAAAQADGLYIDGGEAALAELNTAELSIGPLVHMLDERALEVPIGRSTTAAAALEERVSAAEDRKRSERRGYPLAVAVLALLLALLIAKSLALARARRT